MLDDRPIFRAEYEIDEHGRRGIQGNQNVAQFHRQVEHILRLGNLELIVRYRGLLKIDLFQSI